MNFKQRLLSGLLITAELFPVLVLFNAILMINDDPIFLICVGVISLIIISYLLSRVDKNDS